MTREREKKKLFCCEFHHEFETLYDVLWKRQKAELTSWPSMILFVLPGWMKIASPQNCQHISNQFLWIKSISPQPPLLYSPTSKFTVLLNYIGSAELYIENCLDLIQVWIIKKNTVLTYSYNLCITLWTQAKAYHINHSYITLAPCCNAKQGLYSPNPDWQLACLPSLTHTQTSNSTSPAISRLWVLKCQHNKSIQRKECWSSKS